MKRALLCLALGVYFGIVLIKSEAASWWRIQEMFHFASFHMYGILGLAIAVGVASVAWVRARELRALDGATIDLTPKPAQYRAQLLGGVVFGCGWALTGACPGPIYALIGAGYPALLVVLLSALAGTFAYGCVRERLPHGGAAGANAARTDRALKGRS